jgi:uncharacterized protein
MQGGLAVRKIKVPASKVGGNHPLARGHVTETWPSINPCLRPRIDLGAWQWTAVTAASVYGRLLKHNIMSFSLTSPCLLPVVLLLGSNVFMTLAWYGHLRFKETPLMGVILAAWGIAFIEYWMAVPANPLGERGLYDRPAQDIQEVITLLVFAAFSVLYLKEPITWNYGIGFALIAAGSLFRFPWTSIDRAAAENLSVHS